MGGQLPVFSQSGRNRDQCVLCLCVCVCVCVCVCHRQGRWSD